MPQTSIMYISSDLLHMSRMHYPVRPSAVGTKFDFCNISVVDSSHGPSLNTVCNFAVCLTHTDVFEPIPSAVFLLQEGLAFTESASDATLALRRVGAIEVGDVLVTDIAEPIKIRSACHVGRSSFTNGFCLNLQTEQVQYCGQAHLPISRRRNLLLYLND